MLTELLSVLSPPGDISWHVASKKNARVAAPWSVRQIRVVWGWPLWPFRLLNNLYDHKDCLYIQKMETFESRQPCWFSSSKNLQKRTTRIRSHQVHRVLTLAACPDSNEDWSVLTPSGSSLLRQSSDSSGTFTDRGLYRFWFKHYTQSLQWHEAQCRCQKPSSLGESSEPGVPQGTEL